MKVLKFGGTSVGSSKNINKVISILDAYAKHSKVVCVVSAVGGITDKLLLAGRQAQAKDHSFKDTFEDIKDTHFTIIKALNPNDSSAILSYTEEKLNALNSLLEGIFLINEISPKTSDKLVSFGELLSSFIISETMKNRGISANRKNSQDLIITNANFTKAEVDYSVTNANLKAYFDTAKEQITILPGFIANSAFGEQTTLGRGGSDFTAAIVAAALRVDQLEIWTDVSGMFTTNPKLVKQARPIESISYQEAMELSHFGAKVLYPPTVQPVLDLNIPIHIKNTMAPDAAGTVISNQSKASDNPVKGISNISNIALLTLQGSGMVGIPGFSKRLFETLSNEKINVILITQASSEHSICLGIEEKDVEIAKQP
jgi:aspartokinase/homoserine dehydrogenase 1